MNANELPRLTAPAPSEPVLWLENPKQLDDWLAAQPAEPLTLDTEFERVSTYYPIPGLVQLGLAAQFRLVDPGVAEASAGFRAALEDVQRPKLLYAVSEDLELFRHWLGIPMQGVIDLQLGVAFAGLGFSMGYAKLVERLFGESLDKTLTRSDWISRPLSDLQQRYAIDDVRFLKPMYDWLQKVLAERGLEHALVEESARFAADLASQDDPTRHYLKLRGGWPLSAPQQQVLQALVGWRERECHRQDKPRNWVMADPLLLAMAETLPKTLNALSDIQGLASGQVRRHGDTLLALIAKSDAADDVAIEPIAAPLTRDQQGVYQQLKKHCVRAAESADIPIELLAPRKRLEAVVQQRQLSGNPFFEGWRSQILDPVRGAIEALFS